MSAMPPDACSLSALPQLPDGLVCLIYCTATSTLMGGCLPTAKIHSRGGRCMDVLMATLHSFL